MARRGVCVVQLEADATSPFSGTGRLDAATVAAMLTSTPAVEAAAKAAGLSPDQVALAATPTNYRFLRLEVVVRKPLDNAPADLADKLLTGATDAGRKMVADSMAADRKAGAARMSEMDDRLKNAQVQYEQIHAQLVTARKAADAAGINPSGQDWRYRISNLKQNRQGQMIELASAQTRTNAISPNADPAAPASDWKNVVKLRQQQVDAAQQALNSGKGSAGELADAQAKLAEAKAQLAPAKLAARPNPNGDNNAYQLAQYRRQVAEIEARIKGYDDQLDKLQNDNLQSLLDSYQQLTTDEQNARNRLTTPRMQVDEMFRAAAQQTTGTTLTVLGLTTP